MLMNLTPAAAARRLLSVTCVRQPPTAPP